MQTTVQTPEPTRIVIRDGTSPAAIYQGMTERARVLRNQLEGLVDDRREEISGLGQMSGGDMAPVRAIVQERIARIDKRIAGIEEQIAQADAQVAAQAAVPGSFVRETRNNARDEDVAGAFFGGASTMLVVVLFWAMIKRRRARKRGTTWPAMQALPNELAARMERLENVAESTALEVERIGEGQRFVTKLLSEQKVPVQNKGV